MGKLLQDMRFGLRVLAKTPGVTILVVLSLALGIGATTAVFGVINTVILRTLPVYQPQSLYLLQWRLKTLKIDPFMDSLEGNEDQDERTGGAVSYSISYPAYQRIQKNNTVFSDTFAFAANSQDANIGLGGKASSAIMQGVSGNLFAGLGVSAILGRTIVPSDDVPSAVPVTVVSYAFWKSRMGGEPNAIGKVISMNGTPLTVVGVAPADFNGPNPGVAPEFWIPLNVYSAQWEKSNMPSLEEHMMAADKIWWLGVVGRLKPGISKAQAAAELGVLFRQSLDASNPHLPANADIPQLEIISAAKGISSMRDQYSRALFLLMGMVGLVLLIACANVAGLLMARSASRQREIALRIGLGAGKARVVRQLLTESTMLGLLGGLLAILIAKWATVALVALLASGGDPVNVTTPLDLRVLAFTAAVSILSGIVFGLAPSLSAIRVQPLTTLKQNSANSTMGAKRFRSGKILVGGQVALSLLLLIGAGVLLRTLRTLQRVDLGFDRHSVVLFSVRPGLNGYSGPRLISYYQELERRLKTIPGVSSSTFAEVNPIGQGSMITRVEIPGYTPSGKPVDAYRHIIGPDYFATLRIPVLRGRTLGEQDTATSQKVLLVNRAFAKKYLHGDNPLGHEVMFGTHVEPTAMRIVGMVQDVKYDHIRDEAPPTLYVAYTQARNLAPFTTYQLRVSGDKDAVIRAIGQAAVAIDPNVPVLDVHTEDEMVAQVLYLERTFALLSSVFGGLALVLACVGIYGMIAYTVAQRTNEIGIRMALGAERTNVLVMVLRETLAIVALGLAIGLPLAWMGTRMLSAQVYGLSPHDPVTWLVAVLAIAAVTVAAGFVPARRASQVDPMTALRCE